MKIKQLITAMLIFFTLVPASLASVLCIISFNSSAVKLMRENVSTITTVQAVNLNSFFEQRVADLTVTSRLTATSAVVQAKSKGAPPDDLEEARAGLNYYLYSQVQGQPFIQRILLVDMDGSIVACNNEKIIGHKVPLSEGEWSDLTGSQYLVSDVHRKDDFLSGRPYVLVGVPVDNHGEPFGAMLYVLDNSHFQLMSQAASRFETGRTVILDGSGSFATDNAVDSAVPPGKEEIAQQWGRIDFEQQPDGYLEYREDGVHKIGHYATIGKSRWKVFSSVEYSELAKPMSSIMAIIFTLAVVILLALLCVHTMVTRKFFVPLDGLTNAIRRMRRGEYGERFVYDTPNELGEITAAFNALIDAVQDNEAKLRKSSRELEALVANIPGGVLRTRADDYFSFANISEGYLSLIGYQAQEIKARFHNQFYYTIYEKDREAVASCLREQLQSERPIELEFRMRRSDGSIIWILEKGRFVCDENGEKQLYGVLIDNTVSKAAQEELRLSEQRHRIIMEQSEDIIFEWDVREDTVSYSSNWSRKFRRDPPTTQVMQRAIETGDVSRLDEKSFTALIEGIRSGKPYGQADVRIRRGDGQYLWCRMRITSIYDDTGKVCRAVGAIVDIDEEKRTTQRLLQKSQRDPLTGLYNRETARALIEAVLSERPQSMHALFILDVDNFKAVNDTLGHLSGDAVLRTFSGRAAEVFRQNDIVARIGGDEFLVFASNISSSEVIEQKAGMLVHNLRQTVGEGEDLCEVSASIGVAVFPSDGRTYNDLFRHADAALYAVKKRGKNGFQFYSPQVNESLAVKDAVLSRSRRGAGDARAARGAEIALNIFKILYDSDDLPATAQMLMETLAKYFSVGRAYFIELSVPGRENIYEYHAPGLSSLHAILQQTPSLRAPLTNNYDENGIFYCNDISALAQELQEAEKQLDAVSSLRCAIFDAQRKLLGLLGVDETSAPRLWKKGEIDTLCSISQILHLFLRCPSTDGQSAQYGASHPAASIDNSPGGVYTEGEEPLEAPL